MVIKNIFHKIQKIFEQELEQFQLWLVIIFIISIVFKFYYLKISIFIPLLISISSFSYYKIHIDYNSYLSYYVARIFFFITLSFLAVEYRLLNINTEQLDKQIKNIIVKGEISNIRLNNKNGYITLSNIEVLSGNIKGRDLNDKNIRLSLKRLKEDEILQITLNSIIDCQVDLYPNDNRRPFYTKYFNQYAFGVIKKINQIKTIEHFNIHNRIDVFRRSIQRNIFQINQKMSGGGIVIAIITGNTGFIDKHDLENIRKTGCAHILAISGLHMSIITMFIFKVCLMLFRFKPNLILRYNVMNISWIIAFIFCFFYLQLSDAPISAVRSFVMLFFSILALFHNRKKTSYHILFNTAFIMLLFHPEFVFTPSFQMSFIAVCSLITIHKYQSKKNFKKEKNPSFLKNQRIYNSINYLKSIMLSSIAATVATSFYEIYHFKQYALSGILTNILVIPLTEFITLPLGFVGMLVNGTILSKVLYRIAGIFGEVICLVTYYGTKIPYSFFSMPAMKHSQIFLISVGLLIFMVARSSFKYIGLMIIVLTFALFICQF